LKLVLVQNAIEYGSGEVTVRAWCHHSTYGCDVVDNGPGMTPEEMKQATKPYFRGDRGIGKDGLGLGLSVCEKAVQLLQGKLEFSRAKRSGLCVQVSFEARG
jgi:signal transduction histidine kinase